MAHSFYFVQFGNNAVRLREKDYTFQQPHNKVEISRWQLLFVIDHPECVYVCMGELKTMKSCLLKVLQSAAHFAGSITRQRNIA